jgi:hypothetical protein
VKRQDELILNALDREIGGEGAAGLDGYELGRLRQIAAGIRNLESLAAPADFTERVMLALPVRRRSLWARLKERLVRPHVIRLNLAWETGLAAALLVVALSSYSWGPMLEGAAGPSSSPVVHTRFIVKAPEAKEVSVAGDFNNWRQDECRLIRAETEGVWTVTVPLKPGRYKYMFIVDGKSWQTDPLAESYEQDGFGYQNAVVDVPGPEQA